MKERNEKKKETKIFKDKRVIFSAALACAALILAIVFVASFATSGDNLPIDGGNVNSSSSGGDENVGGGGNTDDTPTGGEEENPPVDEGMTTPIVSVSVSNDYGFFYNQTLNCYYHHDGVDFVADAGVEVLAVEAGVIESIYSGDLLSGTEIVVDHGNGVKTLYRFVEAKEGLQVGDSVKKGDVIATVAEANGDEYKDGAHLHFEVWENGKATDPAVYLPLEEK
ncbi:MAG: M23 family metallopeptidase [Clostridia bacterium]|nr:M23 family metallopeptidase [Clostridia bacterium]